MIAILLMTLAQFIAYTRAELAKAGVERVQFGESVYWRGAPPSRRLAGRRPAAPPERRRDGAGPAGEDAGAPLVLLHGANDQAGTWFAVVPKLVEQHRVIVPDLAGHGESGPHEGPLPLSLMVERLHAVLEHENAKRVTLVGNSMG